MALYYKEYPTYTNDAIRVITKMMADGRKECFNKNMNALLNEPLYGLDKAREKSIKFISEKIFKKIHNNDVSIDDVNITFHYTTSHEVNNPLNMHYIAFCNNDGFDNTIVILTDKLLTEWMRQDSGEQQFSLLLTLFSHNIQHAFDYHRNGLGKKLQIFSSFERKKTISSNDPYLNEMINTYHAILEARAMLASELLIKELELPEPKIDEQFMTFEMKQDFNLFLIKSIQLLNSLFDNYGDKVWLITEKFPPQTLMHILCLDNYLNYLKEKT